MAAFDPAAATAAYLAQMSPAAQAKAVAYTQGGHWLLLWGWLVSLAAAWLILRSHLLSRVEARLEDKKPRPLLVSFLLAFIFLLLDFVLELPWSSYADWLREKQYGLTSQPWSGWFTDNATVFLVQLPFLALFFLALYALMRAAKRSWPLWAGLLAGGFFLFAVGLQPILIEPLINTYKPAPPGAVRDLVVAMGKANGVPTDKIYVYNGSKQSNRYTANVAGLFGSARVAMSDVMFKKGADLAEVRGVVGHEMGHYVHQHVLIGTAFLALMVMLGGALVQQLFPLVRGLLRASDIGGVADPAGLPILMMLAATLSLLATPLNNTETRLEESDADTFSLVHANEPDGLSQALIKTAEYRAPTPSALEEFLFYDHPSVGRRIRKAMDWKAAHMAGGANAPVPPRPEGPSAG
jgi:STE24 endopeptidase